MTPSASTANPKYISPRKAMSTEEIKARIEAMFSDSPAPTPSASRAKRFA